MWFLSVIVVEREKNYSITHAYINGFVTLTCMRGLRRDFNKDLDIIVCEKKTARRS